ncbi:site-2 protease family protein, partial [Vallitalea guaymasensis]
MNIVVAILIFGLLVLVHELGHFLAARKNGILVEEFAIGMGPKLVGIKRGDTLYSIRLLPFGGYCKMLGEDE